MWEQIQKFIADLWDDIAEFIKDVFVDLLSMLLDVLAAVVGSIPLPSFLTNFSVADYIGNDVAYFLMMSGFGQALGIIGAGIFFKFLRRFITLGIW